MVLLAVLIFSPSVDALIISEIMYDLSGSDTNREWIEIYNDQGGAIDLTGWKFFEAGTNHGLNLVSGSISLNQGDYALIVKDPDVFLADHPNFNGTLLDSSFSLSNTGESLAMKDSSLNIVNEVNYSSSWGAAGNGNSLQYKADSWCEGSPTPGLSNSCDSEDEEEQDEQDPQGDQGNQSEQNPQNESESDDNLEQAPYKCTMQETIEVGSFPEELKFGDESEIKVSFNASCYPHSSVKFLVYGSSSRVISYEDGTKITKYASCEEGSVFEDLESKDYSLDIPFFVYPNCNDSYEDGEYAISLRVCSPSWKKYHEEEIKINLSGKSGVCSSNEENEENIDAEAEVNLTQPNISSSKVSIRENDSSRPLTSSAINAANRSSYNYGEVIYESKNSDIKKISAYLTAILFILLIIYLLLNKGKV